MRWMMSEIGICSRLSGASLRSIAIVVLLISGNGCAAAGGSVNVTLRTISSGSYAQASALSAVAVFDEESYRKTWSSMIGEEPMPEVDFTSHAIAFLFAGTRPTGGYSIAVRGASIKGETLVIDAAIEVPPPDSMVTQALTSPYAVVAVENRDFETVEWNP